jgi:hypothetical protein
MCFQNPWQSLSIDFAVACTLVAVSQIILQHSFTMTPTGVKPRNPRNRKEFPVAKYLHINKLNNNITLKSVKEIKCTLPIYHYLYPFYFLEETIFQSNLLTNFYKNMLSISRE